MSYPGNPSASADVRKRVREAFRHSVSSAVDGRRDDALLGCDFILRLDDAFEPAAQLQQMLEQDRPPEAIQELLGAEGEDEEAPSPPAAAAPLPTGAAYSTSTSPALVATFQRLLEARRFEELLSAAQAQAAAVSGSTKLQDLVATAQARFESEPFVREVLDKCREALGRGKLDLVHQLLAKAKGLDASHPGVAEIERLSASAATLSNSLTIDWDDDTPAATAVQEPAADSPPPAPQPTSSGFETDPGVPGAPREETAPSEATGAPVDAFSEVPPDLDLPDLDFAIVEPEASAAEPPAAQPPAPAAPEPPVAAEAEPEPDEAPSFGEQPAEGDEGDDRVRSLLDEGQVAFDQGDYQAAIDSWSRIFLIDIDNEEAASRIERARQLKAEREREVEEVFHEGVAKFDAGDWDAAREAFERVLAEQPSYVLAREYLDRIDERAAGGDAPGADLPEMAPVPSAGEPGGHPARPTGPAGGEEILVPPDPGSASSGARAPAVGGFAVKAKRSALPEPRFLAIGGGVLLVLAIGGYFLVSNWKSFFPNAAESAATGASASQAVLDRAQALQGEGKTAQAIAQLKRIPPQDPAYAEAQSLVSQWEKLDEPAADTGPAPEALARRAALVERARDAVGVGDHFLARRLLEQASAVAPLNASEVDLRTLSDAAAQQYDEVLGLMRDGEYEMALNRLWRRHEQSPDNRDVRRLMVDSYHNLCISDLQRGDPSAARSKAKEALALDPSDTEMIRLERFASTYERRDRDLLYRIFVKYLRNR